LNFQDRGTCVLFGDGAGAVILEASKEPGILSTALHADGSQRDILCVPGRSGNGGFHGSPFMTMDGPAVFKLAVKVLEQVAHEVLEKANLKPEQIDWLVPHQANIRIMEGTAKKMGMSMDKVIVTVHEHGNTSAASIPLALDAGVRSGQIQRGQYLLLEGVGGGFAWGAVALKY
jgi:3-oxoacyl-[acyl-carrier-protein] synthase-3